MRNHRLRCWPRVATCWKACAAAMRCLARARQSTLLCASAPPSPDLPTHTVDIEPDSDLAKLLGVTSWVTNSHHHQTIKDVGTGLRVVGRAKDGTVEAMEATDYPYLKTYQFHPEMMSGTDANALKLFEDFIRACIANKQ